MAVGVGGACAQADKVIRLVLRINPDLGAEPVLIVLLPHHDHELLVIQHNGAEFGDVHRLRTLPRLDRHRLGCVVRRGVFLPGQGEAELHAGKGFEVNAGRLAVVIAESVSAAALRRDGEAEIIVSAVILPIFHIKINEHDCHRNTVDAAAGYAEHGIFIAGVFDVHPDDGLPVTGGGVDIKPGARDLHAVLFKQYAALGAKRALSPGRRFKAGEEADKEQHGKQERDRSFHLVSLLLFFRATFGAVEIIQRKRLWNLSSNCEFAAGKEWAFTHNVEIACNALNLNRHPERSEGSFPKCMREQKILRCAQNDKF